MTIKTFLCGLASILAIYLAHREQTDPHTFAEIPSQVFEVHRGNTFLQVKMFPETGAVVGGARYEFSRSEDGKNWTTFAVVIQDDPNNIPCHQIRIWPNGTAYAFMKDTFASSRDGVQWKIWRPDQAQRGIIKNARMDDSGHGFVELDTLDGKMARFETLDYGDSWDLKK